VHDALRRVHAFKVGRAQMVSMDSAGAGRRKAVPTEA
jgi:hypothetical protein